jgi:Tfp pilus assembly protein PilX
MKKLRMLVDNERGVALMLALVILLTLTGLVLAFLSVSAFEPQISRNQSDTTRARFVADAGIEYAYDTLASNILTWNNYLVGATCTTGAILDAANSPHTLPGLLPVNGTFTVRVRNDCNAGDNKFTGVVVEAAGNATNDTNNKLIVTSVGTFNGTTKTITVVISKTVVPSINAALAFPGIQADVNFNGSTFVIDGRDTRMSDTAGNPTGTNNAVYGITTNPGLPLLETQVENALNNNQGNTVLGRDETSSSNPPATTSGANTIQGDNTLTSQMVTDFAAVLKKHADILINTSASNPYSIQSIGGGTGTPTCTSNWSSSSCWGSTTKPKIVYINGTLDNLNTQYTSLDISGTSEGTGILIIENGNTDINGNFRWNGPVITTGRNVGIRYRGGGYQSVYGATVVNELHNDGLANLEGDIRGNANLLYSKEALDLVQNLLSRRLVTTSSWTDQ